MICVTTIMVQASCKVPGVIRACLVANDWCYAIDRSHEADPVEQEKVHRYLIACGVSISLLWRIARDTFCIPRIPPYLFLHTYKHRD